MPTGGAVMRPGRGLGLLVFGVGGLLLEVCRKLGTLVQQSL